MRTYRGIPPLTCDDLTDKETFNKQHTPNLNAIGSAVPEIQKRGVYVRTCRVVALMTCWKTELNIP